jgi:hypothetical protein
MSEVASQLVGACFDRSCGTLSVRCSEKFPNDCVPDLKYVRGVFGIELTTLLTAHNAKLPFVVTKCVAEVEARGLTTEGIYRLSGFAEEIEAIKMAFDKGEIAAAIDGSMRNWCACRWREGRPQPGKVPQRERDHGGLEVLPEASADTADHVHSASTFHRRHA